MPESELKEGGQIGALPGFKGGLPKMELEGRFKNGTQKGEEDEMKRIQKWSRKCRVILIVVTKIFPYPFSAKDVELTGKVENALRSKSKSAAVY